MPSRPRCATWRTCPVTRIGNTVVARTDLGRAERVVLAGHIDTVPLTADPVNLPTRRVDSAGQEVLWGRGTVDMKGGVAVMLRIAREVARAQPRRHVRVLRGRGDRLAVQRAAPRRAAAPRAHRRRRLRGAAGADRRARRGRLQGHPAGRGVDQGHRLALGAAVEGAQRHPRRRRRARPAGRVRAGDPGGRRAGVPRGAQRRAHRRRSRHQRHPRPVRRDRQLPLRTLAVGGGGRGPRARGVLRASRSTSSTTPAARVRGCTCPPPRRSSRRSACRSRPSRAGPTWPASPRWGCRP